MGTSGAAVVQTVPRTRGSAAFLTIWFGQLVSIVGSALTAFALNLWVYEITGSVTRYALTLLTTTLPGVVLGPVAGAWVDRCDRRKAMVLSDCGAGLCSLLIAVLVITGRLQVWHVYGLTAMSSTLGAIRGPAYAALATVLVPKEQYGRASGLGQATDALSQIAAPPIAVALMTSLGLHAVVLIDVATFGVAIITLLATVTPHIEPASAAASVWIDIRRGWIFLQEHPRLLHLLLYFAAMNLVAGYFLVLSIPFILSFASKTAVGAIMSASATGMFVGGLAMAITGGYRARMDTILGASVVTGATVAASALGRAPLPFGVAAFTFSFCIPVINASSQAIWQAKVPNQLQGRVFATRRMLATSTLPLAYGTAGPLADVARAVLGVQRQDQAIAPLLISFGALSIALAVASASRRDFRKMESLIPDAVSA